MQDQADLSQPSLTPQVYRAIALYSIFTSAVASRAVLAADERRDALDVVEVEGVLAGHGAVQPRLQIRRPGIPAKGRWTSILGRGNEQHTVRYSGLTLAKMSRPIRARQMNGLGKEYIWSRYERFPTSPVGEKSKKPLKLPFFPFSQT